MQEHELSEWLSILKEKDQQKLIFSSRNLARALTKQDNLYGFNENFDI